jgi:hypothetical protein
MDPFVEEFTKEISARYAKIQESELAVTPVERLFSKLELCIKALFVLHSGVDIQNTLINATLYIIELYKRYRTMTYKVTWLCDGADKDTMFSMYSIGLYTAVQKLRFVALIEAVNKNHVYEILLQHCTGVSNVEIEQVTKDYKLTLSDVKFKGVLNE